jgi:hypothetical protein
MIIPFEIQEKIISYLPFEKILQLSDYEAKKYCQIHSDENTLKEIVKQDNPSFLQWYLKECCNDTKIFFKAGIGYLRFNQYETMLVVQEYAIRYSSINILKWCKYSSGYNTAIIGIVEKLEKPLTNETINFLCNEWYSTAWEELIDLFIISRCDDNLKYMCHSDNILYYAIVRAIHHDEIDILKFLLKMNNELYGFQKYEEDIYYIINTRALKRVVNNQALLYFLEFRKKQGFWLDAYPLETSIIQKDYGRVLFCLKYTDKNTVKNTVHSLENKLELNYYSANQVYYPDTDSDNDDDNSIYDNKRLLLDKDIEKITTLINKKMKL